MAAEGGFERFICLYFHDACVLSQPPDSGPHVGCRGLRPAHQAPPAHSEHPAPCKLYLRNCRGACCKPAPHLNDAALHGLPIPTSRTAAEQARKLRLVSIVTGMAQAACCTRHSHVSTSCTCQHRICTPCLPCQGYGASCWPRHMGPDRCSQRTTQRLVGPAGWTPPSSEPAPRVPPWTHWWS